MSKQLEPAERRARMQTFEAIFGMLFVVSLGVSGSMLIGYTLLEVLNRHLDFYTAQIIVILSIVLIWTVIWVCVSREMWIQSTSQAHEDDIDALTVQKVMDEALRSLGIYRP